MNAVSVTADPRRGSRQAGALDAVFGALTMMCATAATYYVLTLLLVAFVEQVTAIEALARAAWLSIHPAVLANLVLAQA